LSAAGSREEFFRKLLSHDLTTYFITFHPTEAPKFGLVKKPKELKLLK